MTFSEISELLEQLLVKSEVLQKLDSDIKNLISNPDEIEPEVMVSQDNQKKIVKYKFKYNPHLRMNQNTASLSNLQLNLSVLMVIELAATRNCQKSS